MAKNLYPIAEPRFVGPTEDVEAIRQCHRDWWAANNTLERTTIVARASRNFAPETLMFNLNGHTYYGLDEMGEVWKHYSEMLDLEVVQLWDLRIFVQGDLAYITSQGVFPAKTSTDETWLSGQQDSDAPSGAPEGMLFRETAIARRDDGQGNPVWKIWHFHCSPAAAADEARPGIGDTWIDCGGARGGAVAQTAELAL